MDFFEYLQQIGLIGRQQRKPTCQSLPHLSETSHLPITLIEFYHKQFTGLVQHCPEKLDEPSQKLLPASICRQFECIAFNHLDKILIACTNPYDPDMREAIEEHIDAPSYCLAPTSQIQQLVMTYFHEFIQVEALSATSIDGFINHILKHGYQIFASDIHIQKQEKNFQYKYRRFGQFQNTIVCPDEMAEPFKNRLLIRAHVPFDSLNQATDCSLTLHHSTEFTVRISYIPTQNGYSIVIRIIRPLLDLNLNTLLPSHHLAILNQYLLSCKDTIIIYGATGTGKSTLFYHLLKKLTAHKKRPISIEDPIESIIPDVFQINLDEADGSYAQHITQILRQDPDAIGISEVRTEEAIKGLSASKMSGALSIATIHALTPLDCLLKCLKMGYPQHELFNQNILMIATKLLPTLCTHCRSSYAPSQFEQEQLSLFPDVSVPKILYEATGCFHCHHTGIENTEPVIFVSELKRELLFDWSDHPSWQTQAQEKLVIPLQDALNESLHQKLLKGDISFETFLEQSLS